MRRFRYYGKKRGHRRTGSPALAGVVEAVLSAVFVLMGCVSLPWMLSSYVLPSGASTTNSPRPPAECSPKRLRRETSAMARSTDPRSRSSTTLPASNTRTLTTTSIGITTNAGPIRAAARRPGRLGPVRVVLAAPQDLSLLVRSSQSEHRSAGARLRLGELAAVHGADFVHHHRGRRSAARVAALGQVGRTAGADGAVRRADAISSPPRATASGLSPRFPSAATLPTAPAPN